MSATALQNASSQTIIFRLLPFTLVIFLGFLAVGIPVAVLPAYVHHVLGYSSVMVGIVIGLQPASTLLTRRFAGRLSDARGPKRASLLGLASAALAASCYWISTFAVSHPPVALGILLVGRILLGCGESLFITALSVWSIARVGQSHTGRAMSWSGVAMYGALAIGAPLGVVIDAAGGFSTTALCAMVFPIAGAILTSRWTDSGKVSGPPASFLAVLRLIWMPGLAMTLASSGVGTITAFLALRFQDAGWAGSGLALSGFGAAYLAIRFLFSGLPDRWGGYRTAVFSLLVEALGLILIWKATSSLEALGGAVLTGLGYSLIFPSLGVEAIRRVPGDNRGLVVGAYLACFDLGLALAGPIAGAVSQSIDLPAAFMAAALASIAGVALTATSWSQARKAVTAV